MASNSYISDLSFPYLFPYPSLSHFYMFARMTTFYLVNAYNVDQVDKVTIQY